MDFKIIKESFTNVLWRNTFPLLTLLKTSFTSSEHTQKLKASVCFKQSAESWIIHFRGNQDVVVCLAFSVTLQDTILQSCPLHEAISSVQRAVKVGWVWTSLLKSQIYFTTWCATAWMPLMKESEPLPCCVQEMYDLLWSTLRPWCCTIKIFCNLRYESNISTVFAGLNLSLNIDNHPTSEQSQFYIF